MHGQKPHHQPTSPLLDVASQTGLQCCLQQVETRNTSMFAQILFRIPELQREASARTLQCYRGHERSQLPFSCETFPQVAL